MEEETKRWTKKKASLHVQFYCKWFFENWALHVEYQWGSSHISSNWFFFCFCICSLEKKMFYSKKEYTMLRPLLAFLMAFRIGLTTPQKQPKDCQFPSTWEGTWYHSGFPHPLNISAKHISSKGTCVQQSGSMFIMVDRYVILSARAFSEERLLIWLFLLLFKHLS